LYNELMSEQVSISGGGLRATVSGLGAELRRLCTDSGLELLWDGDPAVWAGRSPLLFPIVGSVKDDRVRIGGADHAMSRHGFARTATFALVDAVPSRCTWRLRPDAETRKRYPFEFQLDVTYALAADGLSITATVTNQGDRPMPVSFGFHPAFRWPLLPGTAREAHEIRFAEPEPAPIRRLADGLLAAEPVPSPVSGQRLPLADALFVNDALIFDRLQSRQVSYCAPNGPTLTVAFPAMPHLGIWTKPGAGFICIEPWHGFASPADFDGELRDKPGVVLLGPSASRSFEIRISVR
jgi:galactose mutarotase-like enzyme